MSAHLPNSAGHVPGLQALHCGTGQAARSTSLNRMSSRTGTADSHDPTRKVIRQTSPRPAQHCPATPQTKPNKKRIPAKHAFSNNEDEKGKGIKAKKKRKGGRRDLPSADQKVARQNGYAFSTDATVSNYRPPQHTPSRLAFTAFAVCLPTLVSSRPEGWLFLGCGWARPVRMAAATARVLLVLPSASRTVVLALSHGVCRGRTCWKIRP